jgi:hypothetical protein
MDRSITGWKIYLIARAMPAIATLAACAAAPTAAAEADEPVAADPIVVGRQIAGHLATIARTGPQGQGSADARSARDALARHGAEILPQLLIAMDTRNIVAANWLRTVFDEIVLREGDATVTARHREFLEQYAADSRRAGRPRRLALAIIERTEPGFSTTWIAKRLGDPEFGYEAVATALAAGDKALRAKDSDAARQAFQQAFDHARDGAQVSQAAAKLKGLGVTVDPVKHLGLVVDWRIVGPFDAPQKTGFALRFLPEEPAPLQHEADLLATYPGKDGKTIGWVRHTAKDSLGQLNLIDALGTTEEAVAYAYAEIDVPQAGPAQVRCGADDNCTVWLNGQKVFGRDQWLNGTRFDRFITPITLSAGRNRLLVKICQGPHHRDPEVPNNWSLQLRLCDDQGCGIAFQTLTPQSDAPNAP